MTDFIILGAKTACQYINVFPLIKEGIVYIGITHPNRFLLNGEERSVVTNWYNTLGVCVEGVLTLSKSYYAHPEDYPKYDNFDAIEVSRVKDIPYDYEGLMGVPITFLDKRYTGYEVEGYVNGCITEGAKYLMQGSPVKNKNGTDRYNLFCKGKEMYSRLLIIGVATEAGSGKDFIRGGGNVR